MPNFFSVHFKTITNLCYIYMWTFEVHTNKCIIPPTPSPISSWKKFFLRSGGDSTLFIEGGSSNWSKNYKLSKNTRKYRLQHMSLHENSDETINKLPSFRPRLRAESISNVLHDLAQHAKLNHFPSMICLSYSTQKCDPFSVHCTITFISILYFRQINYWCHK